MRTLQSLLAGITLALVGSVLLAGPAAAEEALEATIVKITGTGNATVVVSGSSRNAQEGMRIPVNAEITTTRQEVYLEVTKGVVATVKPGSTVRIDALTNTDTTLELRQGRLVSQIDRNRPTPKHYSVKTGQGVAAARGTQYTVSVSANGLSISTTADAVEFTNAAGTHFTVQAGTIAITPAGATVPLAPVPLATAAASNGEVADMLRDAVQTAATVVGSNLGSMSAESATSIVSQVVAVAAAALPGEAAAFTSQAVAAVTATGSATAGSAALAAGAVTASAVSAVPDQAGQIAAAAAQAAPAQAGVITAAAEQVAPGARDSIVQQVAAATGTAVPAVQAAAESARGVAASAVAASREAISNVVPAPTQPSAGTPTTPPNSESESRRRSEQRAEPITTPITPIDPSINVSPAS